jgi:hypothetical protein
MRAPWRRLHDRPLTTISTLVRQPAVLGEIEDRHDPAGDLWQLRARAARSGMNWNLGMMLAFAF